MKPLYFLASFIMAATTLHAEPAKWCDQDKSWCHVEIQTKSNFTILIDYRLSSTQSSGSNYLETYLQEVWVNAYSSNGEWQDSDRLGLLFLTGQEYKPESCQLTKAAANRMTCLLGTLNGVMIARKFVPTGVYFPSPYYANTQSIAVHLNGRFILPTDSFQFVMAPQPN